MVTQGLLVPVQTDQRFRHFPPETYNLTPHSNLVRFLRVLMGDAGAGQLRKRLVLSRLGQIMSSSYFYDLDSFYGALFGMQRAPAETLSLDPYNSTASSDDWTSASQSDASYRNRLFQFGRAIEYGPSPVGMKLVAEAILSVTCDVYESFRGADLAALTYAQMESYTYGPSTSTTALEHYNYAYFEGAPGVVPNSLQRKQFIISPHRPITPVEANNVLQVIEQLKPADAICQVIAQGPDVYQPVTVTTVWADSNYWEIRSAVTVTSTGATVPYGQVQPGTTISPAVPPFNSYQGEQWFYNKDISGALSYLQDPMQNVLSSIDTQRIVWSDGTYTDFLPTNAPLPWWMALLGRYSQDGVMAINPLSGRGSLATNASASLSDITFDGVDMDALLQTIAQQNTTSNNFQLSSTSTNFWCTDNRKQDDPSRDILEIRFGTSHMVNAVALDVAHFPQHISVEYYDDNAGVWFSMLQHDIVDSVPAVLVNNDDYLLTKIHPQHYGEDHWYALSTKIMPTMTQRVRVVLTRRTGKAPMYSRITTQPASGGGFATIQTAAPYSLAVRRLKVGYSVEGPGDLPVPYLPGGGVIDSGTDIMGSPVQYSMYREGPSGPLGIMGPDQPGQWRCSPQPLASSVVNYYMDVRTPSGTAQVVDRFLINPTHLGVHATLYWSNSTPSPANTHIARDVPLIYPASVINGTVIPAVNGLQFPLTAGTTGNIDVANSALQFDPSLDWWVGLSFVANLAPAIGTLPLMDVRGTKIDYLNGSFVIMPPSMLSVSSADFEDSSIGGFGGTYQCTLTNTTAQAHTGTHSLRATATTAAWDSFSNQTYLPVTPGVSYTMSGWVKPSAASASALMGIGWYSSAHTWVSGANGTVTTIGSSGWTRVSLTAVAPAGAAYAVMVPNFLAGTIGDTFDWDTFVVSGTPINVPVPLPPNGLVDLIVGFTHATNTWTVAYQLGTNPPITVTTVQNPGASTTTYPNIRIGGHNDNFVAATSGMLLQNLVLKSETITAATITGFLTNPEPYCTKGTFNAQDQGMTANAHLRFDDTFISDTNPAGMVGGAPVFYPDLFWTPIAGDYLLTTGYLSLPPTLAKFWKIEMTNLAPEPYEGFLPVQSTVKTFPATIINTTIPGSSTPGYQGPMDVGISTMIAIGQGENPFPSTGTGGAQPSSASSSLIMSPTQVMVSKDPGTAKQLAGASWLYNFTDFHQGMEAPRFSTPGFHSYQVSDVSFTNKIAFFCGFQSIQAVRTSPLAQNDAPVYYEAFLDDVYIEQNTFNQNPGDLATPTDPGQSGLLPCVAQSVSFISTHGVRALQFATSQSDAVQCVLDDDMRNSALASTSWKDTGTWHAVGDVNPAQITYMAGSNSIVFSRLSSPPPPAQNVGGAVHGHMNPPIEPVLMTENLAQSHAITANIPWGGICSAPLLLSARGRAWVAVRYTPITPLTNPLYVQLVDVVTGRLVWQAQTSGAAGAVTEFTAPYDIGSVPGQNVADSLYVQLVQEGKSDDAISIDTLSVFDESIVWEFSVDGGTTFWQAIDSRNDPNGVLHFPVAAQQLVWRTTCYRESMHISSLQIRPIYQGQLNVDTQPFMRGPNLSTFDTTPDVYSDPMFTQWNNPVPRWWYLAFKQYPNLFPDGVPIINVFSNFYNRTTIDNISTTLTDIATRTVTAEPSALEFFGPVTDAGNWVQGVFHRPTTDDVSGSFGDAVAFFVVTPAYYDNIISPTITKLIT
jgi:hypothetical protein